MFLLPHQIDQIMDTAFTSEGLIRLNTLEETDFEEIPIIRQVECLCQHILNENGRLKLTPNGNLPLKVVREMYEVGIRDSYYERHPSKGFGKMMCDLCEWRGASTTDIECCRGWGTRMLDFLSCCSTGLGKRGQVKR